MKTFAFAAFAATCLTVPNAATAAPGTVTIAVRHADLDLATATGLARLDRRIATAARQACGDRSSADPRGDRQLEACRRAAQESARPQRDALAAAVAPVTLAVR